MTVEAANGDAYPRERSFPWLPIVVFSTLVIGFTGYLIHRAQQNSRFQYEQNEKRRIFTSFEAAKSGEPGVSIHSPQLVTLLARDEDCVHNLRSLNFFMADLGDPHFQEVSSLTNVDKIVIYDCQNVDRFLDSIKGMSSLKSIYFESITINDGVIHALVTFPNLQKVRFEQIAPDRHITLLAKELPQTVVEVADPISGKPKRISNAAK